MAYTYGSTTYAKLNGGTTENAYQVRCGYQVDSNSGGTAKVTIQLQVRSVKSNYNSYGTNLKQTTTVAGTKKTAKAISKWTINSWVTFGSQQVTITSGGSKTYSGSFTVSIPSGYDAKYTLKSGSASVTFNITVATVPGHVASISASPTSIKPDGSFTLSWTAGSNGGASIDKYNVDTRRYTGGAWSAWTNNGGNGLTSGSTTLNGRSLYSTLMPGETIQCRVAVHNSVGWDPQDGRPTVSITAYKDGKIMVKDVNGTVREITRIKVKDTGGTVRDIQKVKIKDTSGTIRNIDLYWT